MEADIEPRADPFETISIMKTNRHSLSTPETRTSGATNTDQYSDTIAMKMSSNGSAVARAERQMIEDENSILASQMDDSSIPMADFLDLSLDLEETSTDGSESNDSDIQAAIEDIRKEASQMDQIILYDQLKTLECELEAINRQYSARSEENIDLKVQLEEQEDRCANLELERDLYQADATKLREDLKTCVEKMFDISMYESPLEEVERSQQIAEMRQTVLRAPSEEKQGGTGLPDGSSQNQQLRILGLTSHPRKILGSRLPFPSDPGLLTVKSRQKWSESSDSAHLLSSKANVETTRSREVFRRRGRHSFQDSVVHKHLLSEPDDREPLRSHYPYEPDVNDPEEKGRRMCGMLRRRSRNAKESRQSNIEMMRKQIEELQDMMKTSLSSSEKLRKRIATISRYYEGVIGQLQAQLVEVKAEKCKTDIELRNHLVEAEQSLLAKDKEIARLKNALSKIDKGEV